MSMAKQTFPNATVRIPVINFPTLLEQDQQQRLLNFNKLITSKYNFLSEINPLRFTVNEKDNIHWTSSTTDQIFKHWRDQLNW